jgi:phage terminase large subunit-like protein
MGRLLIVEGVHAGKRIRDHHPPWQPRLVKLIFGHVDAQARRLIREVFACVAKKAGKTSFCAALALTKLLLAEEERELVSLLAASRAVWTSALRPSLARLNNSARPRRSVGG